MSHSDQSTDGSLKKVTVFYQLKNEQSQVEYSFENKSYWTEEISQFQRTEKGQFCFTKSVKNPEITTLDNPNTLQRLVTITCYFDAPTYTYYKLKFGDLDFHDLLGGDVCAW